jgi:hypothetical protein
MIVKGWSTLSELESGWSYKDLLDAHGLADALEEAERKR